MNISAELRMLRHRFMITASAAKSVDTITDVSTGMFGLAHLLLLLIHTLYGFKNFLFSLVPRRQPKPLLAKRRKLPLHLALLLIPDAENHDTREEERVMEECVEHVVEWCKEVGIQRLSVYDRDGVLSSKSIYASPTFSHGLLEAKNNKSFLREPLTPPLSDTDSSRARSPDLEPVTHSSTSTFHIPYLSRHLAMDNEKKTTTHRRRHSQLFEPKARLHTLTLHLLSGASSKQAIVEAARSLILTQISSPRKSTEPFSLTINALGDFLEGESGIPPPELIIAHSLYPSTAPLELHGFPPWQMRLSEIYYAPRHGGILRHILRLFVPGRTHRASKASAISEVEFRRALDEYSGAEMRLGK